MSYPNLIYPVIFTEYNDDGHYFTVTSPNIKGMVTQGDTRAEAALEAVDAIATMLDGAPSYPKPQDPSKWPLKDNESIVYVTVDMAQWYREKAKWQHSKTVRRTITVPEYLNDLAKQRHLNVSRIATEALEHELQQA